jgi:hypothetical protein
MSVWTHVAGTIRFDHWPGTDCPEPDVGIRCAFNDAPGGTEGGLTILKWTNPDIAAVARYTITIFGDLRDYDEQGIINYFSRITKDQDVRQACFTFQVEGRSVRTFVWENDKFVELKRMIEDFII